MKNFIKVLFLIFSILAIQEQACLGDEYDFRKTKWGMSKNQVLKTEQSKPVCNDCFSDSSSDSVLGYNSKVLGKSVAVVYFFINNQLVRANYVLMERHTNKNDYIDDFNDFKQAITKKYGEPAAEEETWKNEIFKNDKSKWGLAISMGHLQYLSHWKTSTTGIFVLLNGDNLKTNCIVSYNSLRHESLVKERKEKKSSDDL